MRRHGHELLIALIAVVFITLVYCTYLALTRGAVPPPSGFVGHGLGVVGFVLMLSTETLYTFRKRWRRFTWGGMSIWLQVLVFTGIVGPCLVLLHSGWNFHGL